MMTINNRAFGTPQELDSKHYKILKNMPLKKVKPFQLWWDPGTNSPIIFDGVYYHHWFSIGNWLRTEDKWFLDHSSGFLLFELKQ